MRFGAAISGLVLATMAMGCGSNPPNRRAAEAGEPAESGDPTIANLHAFARLYGYVRYFHPSDEAAAIDWDRLAVHGATRARDAATPGELQAVLEQLFRPIAPTMRLTRDGATPAPIAELSPADPSGLEVVAWQHLGYGFATGSSVYRSKRRYRRMTGGAPSFGTSITEVDATPYLGRPIRLRGAIRAEVTGPGNQAQMWLRVDRTNGKLGFFNNMNDRPVTTSEWAVYEIEGIVADDAARIVFGLILSGSGKAWSDSFDLAVELQPGKWQPIELADPDFELADSPAKWHTTEGGGYTSAIDDEVAHTGEHSLRIESISAGSTADAVAGDLFPEYPKIGELIEAEIGRGIRCHLPLALYGKAGHTLPAGEPASITLPETPADAAEEGVRLAAVIVSWNVFQHFYPYFDVIDVAWEEVLDKSLERAIANPDLESTLAWLVAQLDDGHGRVMKKSRTTYHRLPVMLEWVEEQAVVTRSADERLLPGDAIVEVAGRAVTELITEAEELISGSPQWKRFRSLRELGAGEEAVTVALLVDRAGERIELQIPRAGLEVEKTSEPIQLLERGIYYVDLERAEMAAIREKLEAIAKAPGVIFDLRGYPNQNHEIISHLLSKPDTSKAWMSVPRIIYPDHRFSGWEDYGWELQVAEPHITGKVVFVTDGRAISYAESFMSFIEHYKLAEIVGAPTAGANGNVNPFSVPGGFSIVWTGMRVRKHDGSKHHTIGIQPTIPAAPTRAGLAAGRDELVERALSLIP